MRGGPRRNGPTSRPRPRARNHANGTTGGTAVVLATAASGGEWWPAVEATAAVAGGGAACGGHGGVGLKESIALQPRPLASSSLLLVNKLCLRYVPLPSFLCTLQFMATAATVLSTRTHRR